MFRSFVPHIFTHRWSAGSKGSGQQGSERCHGPQCPQPVHHGPESLLLILVSTCLAGGPFLDEGPHEIMHDDHEFQMGQVELVNDAVDNLLYHQSSTDFVPGRTPVHQDSRVEVASLHPVLLRECVEGAIVTEFQFYDVRKAAK